MTRLEQMTRACEDCETHRVPRHVFKKDTITAELGTVTHADLLRRVSVAIGADGWRDLAWREVRVQPAPPPPPDQWGNRRRPLPALYWGWSVEVELVDGCRVVAREATLHEEHTYNFQTRHWYTHKDRVIAADLEDFADELGVLGENEQLTPAPACSRCKCMEVTINVYGYYQKQCERCTAWKRSRRGYGRCADCGRPHDRHNLDGSRCGECHGLRQDRAARETPDHREERLYKQARYRFLVPPWERRPEGLVTVHQRHK
jgi:hypothetical protein